MFFKDITAQYPKVERVFEPKSQAKAGRPDWRFHDSETLGVYGYVEAKALDAKNALKETDHQKQLEKYLALGHPVVLTDGIEFVFISPASANKAIYRQSLVSKPLTGDWHLSSPNLALDTLFDEFFKTVQSRVCSEQELIEELARRARLLSGAVEELADLTPASGKNAAEKKTIKALSELKRILVTLHDPRLKTPVVFADFVAQVLVFGLLYAHRVVSQQDEQPKDRLANIRRYFTDFTETSDDSTLRPFRALVELLSSELLMGTGALGSWYSDCELLLAHIKLRTEQQNRPDYHALYERFFRVFDKKASFDFGAFYTPRELAKYGVALARAITSESWSRTLYEDGNKLIDPCCGTGSFLEELIVQGGQFANKPTIAGFEILPAPYALANYRMASLVDNFGENLSIVLTNTLSDRLQSLTPHKTTNLVDEEQEHARYISQSPLTLVIGNPPSSDSSHTSTGVGFKIIEKLLENFRPPVAERTGRSNIQKQIGQNDFIKFLVWSCDRLKASGDGLLVLVLPSSFSTHGTYKWARQWMVKNFQTMWVMDIDADGRSGIATSSIFSTLQGRMLLAGLWRKESNPASDQVAAVYARSLVSLSGAQKLTALALGAGKSSQEILEEYNKIEVTGPEFGLLASAPTTNSDRYEKFWPLYLPPQNKSSNKRYLFERQCSGTKLAPSALFILSSKPRLERRISEISNLSVSPSTILQNWFSGQQKPPDNAKMKDSLRQTIGTHAKDASAYVPYAYRPFVTVSAFIKKEVLQALSDGVGGGTRWRPELVSAFDASNQIKTIGFALAPAPKDISKQLDRIASFCWYLPDNDLCSRGSAEIICSHFPEYKTKKGVWNKTPKPNINSELLTNGYNPADIVFYCYAVLSCQGYLDEFKDQLFRVADPGHAPRIPVTKNKTLFSKIVEMGKLLADSEKSGAGSKGAYNVKFSNAFKLVRYELLPNDGRIVLKDGNTEMASIEKVPREVLFLRVAGYDVLKQWLKLRTYPYFRAEFEEEDLDELSLLLSAIDGQLATLKKLDPLIKELISSSELL
jgi:hypothetical protein